MITQIQYRLLVEDYMEKYNISEDEAQFSINKHKIEHYINALKMILLKIIIYLVYKNIWM